MWLDWGLDRELNWELDLELAFLRILWWQASPWD